MKTLRFHETEDTNYILTFDHDRVRVVFADRENIKSYTAVTIPEFCEMASPEALAAFERFLAKSLSMALTYDCLKRAEKNRRDAEAKAA